MKRDRLWKLFGWVLGLVVTGFLGAGSGVALAQDTVPPAGQKVGTLPATSETEPEALPKGTPLKQQSFNAWLQEMMKPRPYSKDVIVRIDDTHAYPCKACMEWKFLITKESKDTVWLQPLPPEDPQSPLHAFWMRRQIDEAKFLMEEQSDDTLNLLNFNEPFVPPPTEDALTFTVNDGGLPTSGQWRNNFVFGDMNEDGKIDMVMPPPREGPYRAPLIFLGNGDGTFRPWKDLKWPSKLAFDYGGVAVGDFDHDGHQDIVLGVHFRDQYVFHGNGKGDFTRYAKLPSPASDLHSQAVAVADFNGDGWQDLAFLAEVSYDIKTSEPLKASTIWILENRGGKGWKIHREGLPPRIMGPALRAADMNGDHRPDLVISSMVSGWRWLVFFNEGDWKWSANKPQEILASSFYYGVVPEKGVARSIVAAFQQFEQSSELDSNGKHKVEGRSGLVRYTFGKDRTVTWKLLALDATNRQKDPYWRLASGDIDGDGVADLAAIRKQGQLIVFLGDGHGGYVEERSPELKPMAQPFDIAIRDLDGDGRGEIIVMTADSGDAKGGFTVISPHRNS